MKKVLFPVLILGLGTAVMLFFLANRRIPDPAPQVPPPLAVDVMEVTRANTRLVFPAQGTVEPWVQTQLTAEVGGRIIAVGSQFIEGGLFEKGDLLLKIDRADYEVALAQAEQGLRQAEVALLLEQAIAEQSLRDWRQVEGTAPAPPLVSREPQLKAFAAQVEAARSMRDQARRNLERTEIRAPYTGLFLSRQVDLGQFVSPGTPLARIAGTAHAKIRLPLPLESIGFLGWEVFEKPIATEPGAQGPEVHIKWSVPGGNQLQRNGFVVASERIVDERSRMVFVVVRLDDPYNRERSVLSIADGSRHPPALPFGLFVEAEIQGPWLQNVFSLPRSHFRQEGGFVVVDKDSVLRFRPVTPLARDRQFIYTAEGFLESDRLSLTAFDFLPLDTPVTIRSVRSVSGHLLPDNQPEVRDALAAP